MISINFEFATKEDADRFSTFVDAKKIPVTLLFNSRCYEPPFFVFCTCSQKSINSTDVRHWMRLARVRWSALRYWSFSFH